MKKSDRYIKNMALSAIKRSTSGVSLLKYSCIYEGTKEIESKTIRTKIALETDEELICSTIITDSLWTVLTTRKIVTQDAKGIISHTIDGFAKRELGEQKGLSEHEFIKGTFEFKDGHIVPFYVESGKSSMIMIYATQTLMNIATH